MTLNMRPYAGEADLPLIANLINACEEIDRTDEGTSVDELRRDFANPRFDLARDLQVWTSDDGTRRGFRNMGLGRAMVLAGLQRLAADGATVALLGVDSANPTGATRLYESIGFRKQFARVIHFKNLEVGTKE